MFKNKAGQHLTLFAFNDNGPVLNDAANITCKLSLDGNLPPQDTDTVNPTEVEDGFYKLPLLQSETNADTIEPFPESSTPGVRVIAAYHDKYTVTEQVAASTVTVPSDLAEFGPKRVRTPEYDIEAHDPEKLQRLIERRKMKPVSLGSIRFTKVVPKNASSLCHKEDLD